MKEFTCAAGISPLKLREIREVICEFLGNPITNGTIRTLDTLVLIVDRDGKEQPSSVTLGNILKWTRNYPTFVTESYFAPLECPFLTLEDINGQIVLGYRTEKPLSCFPKLPWW